MFGLVTSANASAGDIAKHAIRIESKVLGFMWMRIRIGEFKQKPRDVMACPERETLHVLKSRLGRYPTS
jgi:hypothetical protein